MCIVMVRFPNRSQDLCTCKGQFDICLFNFSPSKFIVTEIIVILFPPPSLKTEDQHVVAACFSPSCSHLGLTVSHHDSGTQLEFHKLPLSSWHTELNQYLEKIVATASAAGEGEGSQTTVGGQQEVYEIMSV